MKTVRLFAGILSLLSTAALAAQPAGHNGDVSCDSSWKICLQSVSTDPTNTLHFITSMNINKQQVDLPQLDPQLPRILVNNNSLDVILQLPGQSDVTIGEITEAIGADSHTAMSREMKLNPGFDLELSSQVGKQVTYCNGTALGFIYERYTYNTMNMKIKIIKDAQLVEEMNSNKTLQPAVSQHSSIIPCKNGQ